MTVAANALITAADLPTEERTLLGIPTMTDALLETKISEASDWIENETDQKFIIQQIDNEEHVIHERYRTLWGNSSFLYFPPVGDASKAFLDFRPVTELIKITDPSGKDQDLNNYHYAASTGIVMGYFSYSLTPGGTWKFSYKAGFYDSRSKVPPALKQAVKLVLAWRWKMTPELASGGDMVPRLIKQSLAGFYSSGVTAF